MPLLEKHPEKIYWDWLSFNEMAIHLLKANQDKIHWAYVSQNTRVDQIFELDYARMRDNAFVLRDELSEFIFEPDRLTRMAKEAGLDMRTYVQHF